MKNDETKIDMHRRHCNVPCCGNCQYYHFISDFSSCLHPNILFGKTDTDFVPRADMVCDGWIEKNDWEEEWSVLCNITSNRLENEFIRAIEYEWDHSTAEIFRERLRQCLTSIRTKTLEYIAFRLLAWLDDNERLPYWDKRKLDATEWKNLCDELFVEFNKRMEKQENGNVK